MMNELSLLSERVERAALAALHAAAPPALRRRLGLELLTVDTALVSVAREDPSILVNRAIGLGVEAPARRETVASIVEGYSAAGVGKYYLHLHPHAEPAAIRGWLAEHGLRRLRGWAKFRRSTEAVPRIRSDLRAERIDASRAGDFGRIVTGGFGMTAASAPLLAALCDHPAWRVYLSFDGDTPAGAAALFVDGEVGWLDWAATLPDFRRRGSQGLLLRRRILDARDAGCRFVMTETGEAVPGDPQHSYRNILRAGFELMDVRENFGVDFSVEALP